MKKNRMLILMITILALTLVMTGCKDKKEDKVAYPFPTPVECTEFNLPEGYEVLSISTTKDDKYTIISSQNPDVTDPEYLFQTFMVTKTEDGWKDPIALNFGGETFPIYTVVSGDGSKLFFTGADLEDFEENGYECDLLIYTADISEEKVSNITLLDSISDANVNIISGIDSKNNLVFTKFGEGYGNSGLACYAELVKGEYEVNAVEINYEDLVGEAPAITPNSDKMVVCNYSLTGDIVKLYVADFNNKVLENHVALSNNINIEGTKVYTPSISGDGKLLYFMRDGVLYKISLGAAIADAGKTFELEEEVTTTTTVEDSEVVGTSSDEFDTSDFALNLRNKSDIATKEGVYYEIFVRSFADSDGNGIGDFNGITAKLDYLSELGVDGLWLMPINASPSYHSYDVTDYYSLNSDYGTEEEFENMLAEAHKRGIKIIMDFVINHTSDEHPWFVGAKSGEDNEFRDYYRWVTKEDTIDYSPTDKSPWNGGVWHRAGNSYYYGIFWNKMPDLNYNNTKVREEIKAAAVKWLEMGVDGFRLDAAMHIYGDNEYKQQEDQLASNLQWWNEFALFCESIKPDVYLVGEAWQGKDVLAEYVQPFDTKFNFAFEEDMINAVVKEKAVSSNGVALATSLQTILDEYKKIDTNYLDGIFGTNHDQDRIMSRVKNVEKAKLVVNIYMTLSGNPFIYYGEEIGMRGAKPDEKIREPFMWTVAGTDMDTTWETASSNTDTIALEEQVKDPASLYNHYKKIIALRKANKALTSGSFTALDAGNDVVMAYTREKEDQKIYVLHNLSSETVSISNAEVVGGEVIYTSNKDTKLSADGVTIGAYSSIIINK